MARQLRFRNPLALALLGFALLAILLLVKHHENIRRLLEGTEGKIGAKG